MNKHIVFSKGLLVLKEFISNKKKFEKVDELPSETELLFSLFSYTPRIVEYSVYTRNEREFYIEMDYYDNTDYIKETYRVIL